MRTPKTFVYFSFHTTTAAFETERFCKDRNISGRLVSVPREMSAGCGIAWRMEPEAYRASEPAGGWMTALEESGIEIEEIREITR